MVILAACRDPGGVKGIIAVAQELVSRNKEVILLAEGQAIEILEDKKWDFSTFFGEAAGQKVIKRFGIPEALLTSFCEAGPRVAQQLVGLLKNKCPVIGISDLWQDSLIPGWVDLRPRLDYICVNDCTDIKIILEAWPEFSPDNIKVTGWPAFDEFTNVNVLREGKTVRAKLGIATDDQRPIVFLAGQIYHNGLLATEVVHCLNCLTDEVIFIPRQHPRFARDAPKEEKEKWEQAIQHFSKGTMIDCSKIPQAISIIIISSVVISFFSTVLAEAAVLRKPNISIWYPVLAKYYQDEIISGYEDEFPAITLGCSAKATNREELVELIKKAILAGEDPLGLKQAQEKHFRLDGKNAKRVADLVMSIV